MHGGWRNKQGSLMALDANRFNFRDARKCSRCGRPALSGRVLCWQHAARWSPAREPERVTARALRQQTRSAEREGRVPPELIAMPVWQAAKTYKTERYRAWLLAAWGQPEQWATTLAAVQAAIGDVV